MSTATFYPDPNVESTSVDGCAFRNNAGGETFATLRAGAGTNVDDSGATTEPCAGYGHLAGGNFYRCYRGIFVFDTSSLPDTATVTAATFSLYGFSKVDNIGITPKLGITQGYSASSTALAASDYDIGNWSDTRICDTDITYAGYSTSAYNDFAFNATGLAIISKVGVTKVGTRMDSDIDNSSPGGALLADSNFIPYYADQTGTGNDPMLVVTYVTTSIKTINGLVVASVKTVNGLAIASVKTYNGLA